MQCSLHVNLNALLERQEREAMGLGLVDELRKISDAVSVASGFDGDTKTKFDQDCDGCFKRMAYLFSAGGGENLVPVKWTNPQATA